MPPVSKALSLTAKFSITGERILFLPSRWITWSHYFAFPQGKTHESRRIHCFSRPTLSKREFNEWKRNGMVRMFTQMPISYAAVVPGFFVTITCYGHHGDSSPHVTMATAAHMSPWRQRTRHLGDTAHVTMVTAVHTSSWWYQSTRHHGVRNPHTLTRNCGRCCRWGRWTFSDASWCRPVVRPQWWRWSGSSWKRLRSDPVPEKHKVKNNKRKVAKRGSPIHKTNSCYWGGNGRSSFCQCRSSQRVGDVTKALNVIKTSSLRHVFEESNSDFIFLRWFTLIRICNQVRTFHSVGKQGINRKALIGNRFHGTPRIVDLIVLFK